MRTHDYLSDDGQVLLLLCTAFALPPEFTSAGLVPFKLSEWNALSKRIAQSTLERPAALLGKSSDEIARVLNGTNEEAERIVSLLDRAGRAALELDSLFGAGLWVVTRADSFYPSRLRETLKQNAPAVLFGSGEIQELSRPGIAIIGSRNVDEAGTCFAQQVARLVAPALPVISGGARGTDRIAMEAAIEAGGISFGVLADSLERTVRQQDVREFLLDRRLVLCTPYLPGAGFSIGGAMGRNKVIYGLARHGVVVSSDHETGGTWAGAVEALRGEYCPVFVRQSENVPAGNRELLKMGAHALREDEVTAQQSLVTWMDEIAARPRAPEDLFDFAAREVRAK